MSDDAGSQQYPWYSLVSGSDLEQGDIFFDCPVLLIPPEVFRKGGERSVTIQRQNVILLTQSCDLAVRNDGKSGVDDVILAAVHSRRELAEHAKFKDKAEWENARKGRFPAFHVLNQCTIPGHEIDFMLVDLRRVFSLSVDVVREIASFGNKKRVRLLPPYREHLSQAFARFFMRVGLLVDIPRFN